MPMKRSPFLLISLCAVALLPAVAWAQRVADTADATASPSAAPAAFEDRVAAVVNDDVISTLDVEARMAMAFLASGLPDTPDVRQHLLMQTLRSLIDEQLELQEAKKDDITVPDDEIDKAMARVATDNHIPGGDMKAFLASRGIPPEALMHQIRASLAWSKVVQRELRPSVQVGDDEVDAVIDRMRANAGKEEYLVSEIFLPVDSPKDEEQVKQFGENLVQKLRQGGNFGAIAHQFSQNASAAAGGDIGWIEEEQLAPELNSALQTMQVNQVAGPVRAASGYYILGLRDKRVIAMNAGEGPADITVELQQLFRP
ncbi:MAG TPA: peptidylprolyl isomerase, partial [Alphaproteobacteria bacterium]|nr:peptidylprolyl isomerase [Alphaproteobacteria bacterium]